MSESPLKKMKFTQNVPYDLVGHIMSFLPIKNIFQNHLVAKNFRNTEIRYPDLDFTGIFFQRCRQMEAVGIIQNIFHRYKGSKINRFLLVLNHIGVEDKILSWIKTCLDKNIEELDLDFSKSRRVIKFPIDFSAIETLTILKLKWCKFEIPNDSPKGLRLLRTLSLMRTEVTKEMIEAVFSNCFHLESLELIKCRVSGTLRINARNHKKFKSLVMSFTAQLSQMVVDAPTLEFYKHDGFVRRVKFSNVDALKEADLHYKRSKGLRYYDSSGIVLTNVSDYTRVHVLATTNIFLEAFTYRYTNGKMRKPTFKFWNLKEFHILFKAPTICTLFDIAEFLQLCPKLEKVLIDLKKFTFEPGYFWMLHHKEEIEKYDKELYKSIKEVKINGYKSHSHEVEIVKFFVKNAQSLEKLELTMPKRGNRVHEADYASIDFIKSIFPRTIVSSV